MKNFLHRFFKIALLAFMANAILLANPPKWAKSGICDEKDCAVGEASKKEGEAQALARALKNLRLSLGTSVQANYEERINSEGESKASAQTKIYASMQNIGYKVLDKFSDDKKIYIKIQYEPNKKILPNEEIGEFSIISNFEKLCKSRDLDGYYCVSLGKKYENGENDLAKNPTIALKYYEQGCKMGTLEGCVYAGDLSQNPQYALENKLSRGEKSSYKVRNLFAKACDGGLGLGCQRLASVEKDALKRRDLYKKACLLDDALSCALLGEIYEFGLAHLQKNSLTAEVAYEDSKSIDKNGDGAVILASKLKDKPRRIREYKKLCDANNARACALLGQEENNLTYLEKASALDSARGLYFLALKQNARSTKIELLKKSCTLGEAKDFTKGCLELGNLYAPAQESIEYYSIACGSLFYSQEACEKLYDISPKTCNNDVVCEQIAKSRQVFIANNSQDLDMQESSFYQHPTNNKNKQPYDEHTFLSPRFSVFLGLGIGAAGRINLAQIKNYDKVEAQSSLMLNVKIGTEVRLLRQNFTPFIAPFVGISNYGLFTPTGFEDLSSWSTNVDVTTINVGSQAGLKIGGLRLYALVDYGHRLFSESRGVPVPITNTLGIGGGIAYRWGYVFLSLEYFQATFTYNGGEIKSTRPYKGYGTNELELVLNDSTHKTKSPVFLVSVGLAF